MPTDEGWLYLCTFIDLFSRRVVGWSVSQTLDRNLAIAALRNAVANRHPKARLVIHTDRGCQYTDAVKAIFAGILFQYTLLIFY